LPRRKYLAPEIISISIINFNKMVFENPFGDFLLFLVNNQKQIPLTPIEINDKETTQNPSINQASPIIIKIMYTLSGR